jgi:threonine dehydratase
MFLLICSEQQRPEAASGGNEMRNQDNRPTGWGGPPVARPALAEVRQAATRLEGVAVRTPLLPLADEGRDPALFLKPETLQPAGSYKLRGVYNWAAGLSVEERQRGLSTHSSGNTALALGYVARLFGVSARSLMPDSVPAYKVHAIRAAGVEPKLVPMSELLAYVFEERWRQEPYPFLNPWADPRMLAGSGTLGLEILADLPDLETVFVPVGGGGLVIGQGGTLKTLKPSVRVVGVQSQACPALHASFAAGRAVWVESKPSLCDGTAVPLVVEQLYPTLRDIVDEVMLVSEEDALATVKRLALGNRLVVEGSGAMSVAAALATPAARRGRAVCILSGGSIGTDKLVSVLGS